MRFQGFRIAWLKCFFHVCTTYGLSQQERDRSGRSMLQHYRAASCNDRIARLDIAVDHVPSVQSVEARKACLLVYLEEGLE